MVVPIPFHAEWERYSSKRGLDVTRLSIATMWRSVLQSKPNPSHHKKYIIHILFSRNNCHVPHAHESMCRDAMSIRRHHHHHRSRRHHHHHRVGWSLPSLFVIAYSNSIAAVCGIIMMRSTHLTAAGRGGTAPRRMGGVQKARNWPFNKLIEATSFVERSNATVKDEEGIAIFLAIKH